MYALVTPWGLMGLLTLGARMRSEGVVVAFCLSACPSVTTISATTHNKRVN